jgi:hypothetical protein
VSKREQAKEIVLALFAESRGAILVSTAVRRVTEAGISRPTLSRVARELVKWRRTGNRHRGVIDWWTLRETE